MRFVCDSCRAQYTISDEKVGPKGVKVRCKKCSHVILVRKADPLPFEDDATRVMNNPFSLEGEKTSVDVNMSDSPETTTTDTVAPRNGTHPGAVLSDMDDHELSGVFDQVFKSATSVVPAAPPAANPFGNDDPSEGHDERTRVVSLDQLKKLAQEGEVGASSLGEEPRRVPEPTVPEADWYVAVNDEQRGPLTLDEVRQLWDRGEITADSLCWRAGFADWTVLSEVPDLAAALAPKPIKPRIVVRAQGASGAAPSAQANFSGGRGKDETAIPSPEVNPQDTGSWKPSAASALAFLAMEEVEASSKAAPKKNGVGIPEPHSEVTAPDALTRMALPSTDTSSDRVTMPAYARPPPSAAMVVNRKWAIVGVAVLVMLLGLVAAALVLAFQNRSVTPASSRPLAVSPPPSNAAPQPPNGISSSHPAGTAPDSKAPSAQAAPPGAPPVAAAPPAPPKSAASELPPPPSLKSGVADRRDEGDLTTSKGEFRKRRHRGTSGSSNSSEEVAASSRSIRDPLPGDSDKAFEEVFGSHSKRTSDEPASKPRKASTGYIPPPPGQGDVLDHLTHSDITQVVLSYKPAIVGCINEQRKRTPGLAGTLVMRWTVLTNGKTSNISAQSDEFKSTYMASCIGGLIKTWTFPRHKVQGEPIDFPFKF